MATRRRFAAFACLLAGLMAVPLFFFELGGPSGLGAQKGNQPKAKIKGRVIRKEDRRGIKGVAILVETHTGKKIGSGNTLNDEGEYDVSHDPAPIISVLFVRSDLGHVRYPGLSGEGEQVIYPILPPETPRSAGQVFSRLAELIDLKEQLSEKTRDEFPFEAFRYVKSPKYAEDIEAAYKAEVKITPEMKESLKDSINKFQKPRDKE